MESLQIALAAVLHAASKEQENLDGYVTESLFRNVTDKLSILIEAVRSKYNHDLIIHLHQFNVFLF